MTTRRSRLAYCSLILLLAAPASSAQQSALSAADSTLVWRILLAEDQRDASNPALAEGAQHPDPRIQVIARRAAARIGDPKFASRDSFPPLPPPPAYAAASRVCASIRRAPTRYSMTRRRCVLWLATPTIT